MKKYRVELVDSSSTTVTALCMSAGDGFVRFFTTDEDLDPTPCAAFVATHVVSAVEVVEPGFSKDAELTTLSRKYPVYAYGKGDLKEALQRCLRDEGLGAWRYLGDIIRDLHVGK